MVTLSILLAHALPCLLAAGQSNVPDLRVIETTYVGSPNVRFGSLGPLAAAPGGHVAFVAAIPPLSFHLNILVLDGEVILTEGDPAPWTMGVATVVSIVPEIGVGAQGQVVINVTTTGWPGPSRAIVARDAAGQWRVIVDTTLPLPGGGGVAYGDDAEIARVLDDGSLALVASASTLLELTPFVRDTAVIVPGTTVPPGEMSGLARAVHYAYAPLRASPNGEHWMAAADLTGDTSTASVLIVDGSIIMQDGHPLPGSPTVIINSSFHTHAAGVDDQGNWVMLHWDYTNGVVGRVIRNAEIVAMTGEPVVPGASERWLANSSSAIDALAMNGRGDWVLVGNTDFPVATRSQIVVLNGERIVAREGDPIDLDENGLFDDNVLLGRIEPTVHDLTEDRRHVFHCQLTNDAGVGIGRAIVALQIDDELGEPYCASPVNSSSERARISAAGSSIVWTNDVRLRANGLPRRSYAYFLLSRSVGDSQLPGVGAGRLCLGAPVGHDVASGGVLATGASGRVERPVDLIAMPLFGGPVAVRPGESWYFQCWFRDVAPGRSTNVSDGLRIDFR